MFFYYNKIKVLKRKSKVVLISLKKVAVKAENSVFLYANKENTAFLGISQSDLEEIQPKGGNHIIGIWKRNKRMLFIISLWIIIILVIYLNPNRPVSKQNYYLLGDENSQITLEAEITFQDKEHFPDDMDINYRGLYLPMSLIFDSQILCVHVIEINIAVILPRIIRKGQEIANNGFLFNGLTGSGNPLCIEKNDPLFLNNNNRKGTGIYVMPLSFSEKLEIPFINLDYYIYPYNQIILTSDNKVYFDIFDSDGKFVDSIETPVLSRYYIDEPGWEVSNIFSGSSYKEIRFSRPILYRFLTPVLMVILIILTITISTLEPYTRQVELGVGLFLGVWGIRQVLLPESIYGISFVDYFFLGVYTIIGISLVITPLNNIYKKIKSFNK